MSTGAIPGFRYRVPTGAQSGLLQVITDRGSVTFELTVTSPWISNISLQRRSTDILVTVNGTNFGSTRGSSSVTVGSTTIPSSSFLTWTSTRIRFSIPHNTGSADLKVRTSEGTSNAVSLELPGPYLRQVSPNSLHPGDRLTLSGSYFNHQRGNGYVLFHPDVRPSSSDYVSWGDRRIIVKVPARAQSGNVKVVTLNGSSGDRRIEVEEVPEPRITSVTPNRVRYNQVVTIRGTGFGDTRGTSKVVFYLGQNLGSSQYVSWSDTRIQATGTYRSPNGQPAGRDCERKRHLPSDDHLSLGHNCFPPERQGQYPCHRYREQLRRFSWEQLSKNWLFSHSFLYHMVEQPDPVSHSRQHEIRKSQRPNNRGNEQRCLFGSHEPLPEPGIPNPRGTRGSADPDWCQFQIDSRRRLRSVYPKCPSCVQ